MKIADCISGGKDDVAKSLTNLADKCKKLGKVSSVLMTCVDIVGTVTIAAVSISQAVELYNAGYESEASAVMAGCAIDVVGGMAAGYALTGAISPYLIGFGAAVGGPVGATFGAIVSGVIGYGLAGLASSEIGEFVRESWYDIVATVGDACNVITEEIDDLYGGVLAAFDPNADGAYFDGNNKDDYITGGDGDNKMEGYAGDDRMYGRSGKDTMYGGEDNDVIYGESGNDVMEEKGMAFINDYLTEEEKAKFEEYNVMYPRECDHSGRKVGVMRNSLGGVLCTLDREREIYLFQAENSEDRREYDEYIDYFTLVIVKDNKPSVMYINLEKESGMTREDKDYDFLWKCKGWDMNRAKDYSQGELMEYVKEALCAYGCTGSVKNLKFNVKFNF